MIQITHKYKHIRPTLKAGDLILCNSNKLIARAIKYVDSATFHHCEIIDINHGRVMGIGAHPEGCRPDFLSNRMKVKHWSDFAVMRADTDQEIIDNALATAYKHAENFNKYDYKLLLQIAVYQLTGVQLKFNDAYKLICSEFTQLYGIQCGAAEWMPENLIRSIFTPADHIRVQQSTFKTVIDFG